MELEEVAASISEDIPTVRSGISLDQQWLKSCIASRISSIKGESTKSFLLDLNAAPVLDGIDDEYTRLVKKNRFNPEERLLLALSLCNHYDPRTLNGLMETAQMQMAARCLKSENGTSVIPTAETFFFLIAHGNSSVYLRLHRYFGTDHPFYKESILELGDVATGVSKFDGTLSVPVAYRDLLLYNKHQPPRFSSEFPAHLLRTKLSWNDLVLMPHTLGLLEEMKHRLIHESTVRKWETTSGELGDHMRPGLRVLLYGASGQGKTLTTALMGQLLNRDVYRIDLSAVISKYVGETSKNLRNLFDTAERKNWIIFIDEGDALLGMRSDLSQNQSASAHGNNQDVAYILQRLETFDGIIVVATNLANNIDAAFERRFEGRIQYVALSPEYQLQVWNNIWPKKLKIDAGANLPSLFTQYSLSPASIVNVIQRIAILMAEQDKLDVPTEMVRKCVMDEALKYKGR